VEVEDDAEVQNPPQQPSYSAPPTHSHILSLPDSLCRPPDTGNCNPRNVAVRALREGTAGHTDAIEAIALVAAAVAVRFELAEQTPSRFRGKSRLC
jgi:hypothetical protein